MLLKCQEYDSKVNVMDESDHMQVCLQGQDEMDVDITGKSDCVCR